MGLLHDEGTPTPFNTLIQIYRSLIFPNIYYGIAAWDQAAQVLIQEDLNVTKTSSSAGSRSHAIPLLVSANVLPFNKLYFETVCSLKEDISVIYPSVHQAFIHTTLDFLMLVTYMLINQD